MRRMPLAYLSGLTLTSSSGMGTNSGGGECKDKEKSALWEIYLGFGASSIGSLVDALTSTNGAALVSCLPPACGSRASKLHC